MVVQIPNCAWRRSIGLGWENPYTVRYASNLDDGAWHGAPLGGFGAGCIGRSHKGDFNLWHIDGGEHVFQSMPACQFSVFEQTETKTQAYALCTEAPAENLQTWKWYPQENSGTYHALYPRSWFRYENVYQATLTCEQFSPIIAENYQETSYPVAIFQWTAQNPTDQPITLSIMMTWQNMVGWFTNALKSPDVKVRDDGSPEYTYQPRLEESDGNFNQLAGNENLLAILMRDDLSTDPEEGDGEWAIATLLNPLYEVTYHTRWNPKGDGSELWQTFSQDGTLPDIDNEMPASGEQLGAAIAVKFTLKPGQTLTIPFVLSWDLPVTEFAEGVEYFRRYTDFFGRTGQNAVAIARTALKHHQTWREKIEAWQQPIVDRGDLPDWFKMALFNELYDLTQGGALWSAADERDPVGQFAILECIDYRWYESLDVRLYGSFGLLMLWSELEKSVIRAFARAIPARDDRTRVIGYYHTIGAESPQALRKAKGATPHDLGAPNEHVWEKTNYTSYQDCNLWKDLGSDFVLQVYRDYLLTGAEDVDFLVECWDAIVETLHYLKQFDQDNDGIPENSGAPDQTFDDWRLQGISAYCGGLWIAALEAAIAIAQIISASTEPFQSWLTQARPLYQEKLWNGSHYRLDSNSGSDIVMADQLCGQFYTKLLNLPDVVPLNCATTALKTVYDACFVKFNHYVQTSEQIAAVPSRFAAPDMASSAPRTPRTTIGAANGVRPDGSPENPNATHPLEVWTGINFGLAAFYMQMDLKSEAWNITESVVRQIYDNGLQFRTPEAITATGTFRACHYLRAMAIWAIYGVLTNFEK
jgi:non-lysosomal glucosylceramidase